VWLAADPRTPDLAAQIYRVNLFRSAGAIIFDTHWYAGHHLPGYSLVFPALASLVGIRALGAIAVVVSVAIFERVVRSVYGPHAKWGGVVFALAATGDIWSGRLTFALGVTFALAALLALTAGASPLAFLLAIVCAACSPVAGLLLALAAATHALQQRSARVALLVLVPVLSLLVGLSLLFPEGGYEPFPVLSFLVTAVLTAAFWWSLAPQHRELLLGAGLYLAACTASLVIHTPIGSNVERYGVLLAAPLLLCALASERKALTPIQTAILTVMLVWIVWGPVRESAVVAGNPSTDTSYYLPVERFMASHGGPLVRLEVPLTRSHWEAALLAPHLSLARGWDKQLDERDDAVLLSGSLNPAGYERWLGEQAVGYVALPDVKLDPSSAREGAIIRRGLPFLREVFTSAHWRIYRVLHSTPMAAGPGVMSALSHNSFTLRASRPGRFLVRIHYTRYWTLIHGSGCVSRTPDGWTSVSARASGSLLVVARFSLARAFGSGSSCSSSGSA
jgi:hypothetical protein